MPRKAPNTPLHGVNETVSMNECTGMMPAALDAGGTNLGELLAVHPPEAPTGKMSAKKAAIKSLKL